MFHANGGHLGPLVLLHDEREVPIGSTINAYAADGGMRWGDGNLNNEADSSQYFSGLVL